MSLALFIVFVGRGAGTACAFVCEERAEGRVGYGCLCMESSGSLFLCFYFLLCVLICLSLCWRVEGNGYFLSFYFSFSFVYVFIFPGVCSCTEARER